MYLFGGARSHSTYDFKNYFGNCPQSCDFTGFAIELQSCGFTLKTMPLTIYIVHSQFLMWVCLLSKSTICIKSQVIHGMSGRNLCRTPKQALRLHLHWLHATLVSDSGPFRAKPELCIYKILMETPRDGHQGIERADISVLLFHLLFQSLAASLRGTAMHTGFSPHNI